MPSEIPPLWVSHSGSLNGIVLVVQGRRWVTKKKQKIIQV